MGEINEIVLRVRVENDRDSSDHEAARLIDDFNALDQSEIITRTQIASVSPKQAKGDPITIGAIVLAAVGGGGAPAKGFSPNGFFFEGSRNHQGAFSERGNDFSH